MAIPIYLALTGAEFRCCRQLPAKIGWMACHFSPYGTGLSNLPSRLPEGSLLILNDRTPIRGHDPQRIFEQLSDVIRRCRCSALLVDLQRPDSPESNELARALTALPCPVAVSAPYADNLDCPVFLPPVPILTPVDAYLRPWQGREIWLDAALEGMQVTVTPAGSRSTPLSADQVPECAHDDKTLCCHYRIDLAGEQAVFTLRRTREDVQALLSKAEAHGAVCAVGLYQEFNEW